MKMGKTETILLDRLKVSKRGTVAVFGNRNVQAAKKLHYKGLADFTNESCLVRNCIRQVNGDYRNAFVYQGLLKTVDAQGE